MDTTVSDLRFGRFQLDANRRELSVDGVTVKLGARAFDVLLALVERRDRIVSKNELLDLVWPCVVVEENNLQVQISLAKKAARAAGDRDHSRPGLPVHSAVEGVAQAS